MFSPDSADRTLPPTERRRREARARGDVVRSGEFTTAVTLLAISLTFRWLAPALSAEIGSFTQRALKAGPVLSATVPDMTQLIRQSGHSLMLLIAPLILVALIATALANLIQTGWVWVPALAIPQGRLRTLLSWDRFANTVGVTLRLGLLATVAWYFLLSRFSQVLALGQGEFSTLLMTSTNLIGELLIQLSVCLIVIASADYLFQFWRREQRLKMTIEERRQEQKDDQIDPELKRRRARSWSNSLRTTDEIESVGDTRR